MKNTPAMTWSRSPGCDQSGPVRWPDTTRPADRPGFTRPWTSGTLSEMNAFTITAATEADVPLLLTMIRELAEFEHLAHELEATEASLRAALFGERPVAGALLAWQDGQAVGYAVYYRTFSTFVGKAGIFLEDLYVRPDHRKHGVGRALLEKVAAVDLASGGGRFEWIALRWNENAFRFYRSLGAEVRDDWALLRMNPQQVRNLVSAKIKVTP
jgi:GNAT superfamily N-acetyltransferase